MTSTDTDRERIDNLNEKCRLLQTDINELTSEIIEMELSREILINELKQARRELYREFAKIQKSLNDSDSNKNTVS